MPDGDTPDAEGDVEEGLSGQEKDACLRLGLN